MKIGKVKKGNYEYYRLQVTDSSGKRKEFLGKTKKEVKQKYEEFLKNDITNLNLSTMTVEEFFHYYLFEVILPSKSIKDKTFTYYEIFLRCHIKDSNISKIKIVDLKKEHLQKYFNEKQKENYKISTLKTLKGFISIVLTYAENEDIIKKNYIRGVKLQKETVKENIKLLTDKEIEILLRELESDKQLLIIVKLALATGMRINEILALTENDFDFKNNSINVNKTVSRFREYDLNNSYKSVLKATSPKTKNSVRVVYLPNSIIGNLKDFIRYVKQDYLKNSIKYNNNKILFTDKKFSYLGFERITPKLNRAYKKCKINQTGFHVLRHTHISKLYRAGINQKIIQEQVGHSNLNMTMHYTHIETKEQYDAVQNLNHYFS